MLKCKVDKFEICISLISARGVIIIQAGTAIELQTNLREKFTIIEKAPPNHLSILTYVLSSQFHISLVS